MLGIFLIVMSMFLATITTINKEELSNKKVYDCVDGEGGVNLEGIKCEKIESTTTLVLLELSALLCTMIGVSLSMVEIGQMIIFREDK